MASEWDPYVSFQKYVRDSANYLSIITLQVSSLESSNVQKEWKQRCQGSKGKLIRRNDSREEEQDTPKGA